MVNQSVERTTAVRLSYLDGLRGSAALMVVLFHCWSSAQSPHWMISVGNSTPDLLAPMAVLGGSRVILFFVLSGFLLYLPFARREAHETMVHRPAQTLAQWLWQRFRRLAVPYYAAIPFALVPILGTYYINAAWHWLRHQPQRPIDVGNVLDAFPECLFFAHGMVPGSEIPVFNGALWTMTPEVQLYFAFPLLVVLARSWQFFGKRMDGLIAIVVIATSAILVYRFLLYQEIGYAIPVSEDGSLGSAYHCLVNSFLGRWAEFALGMGAAGLVARKQVPSRFWLVPLCALSMGLFLYLLGTDDAPFFTDALGGLTFALLILCCAAMPTLAAAFSWRFLIFLGSFSYSLYLIHSPLLVCLHRVLQLVFHQDTATGGLWLLPVNVVMGLPLALLVARGFWWLFERPFLSRKDRKEAARRESVSPVAYVNALH